MVESSPDFVSPVVPDRADQPVSETTERFLRAIAERVPVGNIEELHLFSPLRQGSVETGIAVVASRVIVAPAQVEDVGVTAVESPELSLSDAWERVPEPDAVLADVEHIETASTADDDHAADAADTTDSSDAVESKEAVVTEPTAELPDRTIIERHTVYTARYRLVIKGPERGRWESDVVEEADAPLLTVETVVRGVQRRAGEDTEIVRYNARQIAKILRITLPE